MSVRSDIFISYSSKDLENVSAVVNTMEAFGATCWFQLRNSKQSFAAAIVDGIDNTSAFVVFLSPASVSSIYVLNEIEYAIDRYNETEGRLKILPVIIGDLDFRGPQFKKLKIFLGSFNMLFEKDFDTNEELVQAIFDQIDFKLDRGLTENSLYSASSDVEKERIMSQNMLFNRYTKSVLDEAFEGFKKAVPDRKPNVLDVGCSDGDNIFLRLKDREFQNFLGVDASQKRILMATENYRANNVTFLQADATADIFEDTLREYLREKGLAYFDIIHISAVLLHLKNPAKLIQIFYNVLSPEGYLFIQDEDDGMNFAYPANDFFDNCFFIWDHSLESGDRRMGRKIPTFLREAGFSKIDLKRSAICSLDWGGELKETLWDLYFNPYLWDANSDEYFDDVRCMQMMPDYVSQHDEMKRSYMRDEITVFMGLFLFLAQKW